MLVSSVDPGLTEAALEGNSPGASTASTTHQLAMLRAHGVSILQQGLKLVVLRERDYFQDCTKLGKNLQDNICTSDLVSSKLMSY